jgi:hypothetical protein
LGNPNQQRSSQETEGFYLVADAVVAVVVVAVAGAAVAAACAFGLAPVCVTRQIFVWPLAVFLKLEY